MCFAEVVPFVWSFPENVKLKFKVKAKAKSKPFFIIKKSSLNHEKAFSDDMGKRERSKTKSLNYVEAASRGIL